MDQLQQFIHKARTHTYVLLVVSNGIVLATWYVCTTIWGLDVLLGACISILVALLIAIPLTNTIVNITIRPLKVVWQAILFVTPGVSYNEAPIMNNLHYATDLATNLVNYVYKLGQVSAEANQATTTNNTLDQNFIANSLPLPLVLLDADEVVVFVNQSFAEYVGKSTSDIIGKTIYATLDFSFTNDETFGKWISYAKDNTVTTQQSWEHVRLTLHNDTNVTKLVDMAGFYNKDNPQKLETMLVLFDHTDFYGRDDQAINFVALAVHELRTPLTMLRGYIEALEEELSGKLNPELDGYMRKMKASSQQLTNFVNNVLNVARIEEDQMMLSLQETNWATELQQILEELSLRASVHGIAITANIQPNLPTVAIDKVSIAQVMNNLIDNAIKYSGASKEIVVSTGVAKDGSIETTIQDFGVGIPTTAIPNLFEKFYRDYHNKQHVGGTGIGLYLSKKLVSAQGGNIWVQSKEGEGSTFAFTLIPYTQLAEELKNKDNNGIVRSAHGWIKNHSMYRR